MISLEVYKEGSVKVKCINDTKIFLLRAITSTVKMEFIFLK